VSVTHLNLINDPEDYRQWRLRQHCPRCAGGVPDCPECHGVSAPPESVGPFPQDPAPDASQGAADRAVVHYCGPRGWHYIAAFLLLLCLALPAEAQTLRGSARVLDGDTLEVSGQKVRLHGIDAPELSQTCKRASGSEWHCGWEAAVRLEQMISGMPVRCAAVEERDRYGRIVAVCFRGQVDLGGALVVRGLAMAYRKYSSNYDNAEATAKAAQAGIWAGSFVAPWEWRKGVR